MICTILLYLSPLSMTWNEQLSTPKMHIHQSLSLWGSCSSLTTLHEIWLPKHPSSPWCHPAKPCNNFCSTACHLCTAGPTLYCTVTQLSFLGKTKTSKLKQGESCHYNKKQVKSFNDAKPCSYRLCKLYIHTYIQACMGVH